MERHGVRDEARHPDEWQNDPMPAEDVEQDIADCDSSNGSGVEPKEHAYAIGRPEIRDNPVDEPTIHKRFVNNVDEVRHEEPPEQETHDHGAPLRSSLKPSRQCWETGSRER